jgi:hypothetical protein
VTNNRDRDGYFDYARLSSSSNFTSILRDFFTALARIMTMLVLRTWGIRLAVPPPAAWMYGYKDFLGMADNSYRSRIWFVHR